MTFIPTPGCVRTDIQFSLAGQQVHNIIWCSREANWTQAEREALNSAIEAWWTATARGTFSTQLALVQITTVNQEAANAPSSTLVVSPASPGTGGATVVPNNVAACATLRTDLRGRSYRGRMYLAAALDTARLNSIQWTTAYIAQIITILGALKTAIEALGAVWVVVSKFTNKVPRASGLKTPITAVSCDQYMDSQRRRLGLRGV